jgi:hypothetical protein
MISFLRAIRSRKRATPLSQERYDTLKDRLREEARRYEHDLRELAKS